MFSESPISCHRILFSSTEMLGVSDINWLNFDSNRICSNLLQRFLIVSLELICINVLAIVPGLGENGIAVFRLKFNRLATCSVRLKSSSVSVGNPTNQFVQNAVSVCSINGTHSSTSLFIS